MIGDDGAMLDVTRCAHFAGVDRFEARAQLASFLDERGLFRGRASHAMRLAVCSRSGDILEPLIRPQWFVRTAMLAERARALAESGEIALLPAAASADWHRWLDDAPGELFYYRYISCECIC